MTFFKSLGGAMVAALLTTAAWAEAPALRAAVLKFGTVNWELNTIKQNGLDAANGFDLQVQGMAGSSAAQVAFQGGEADVIVSDWLWVARQRASGKDYVFIPYSKAVGGLLVGKDSTAQTLADLKGTKIGIAGGPLDKSWLILRAYAEKNYGLDLAAETEQVFGAPPLIFKTALSGETAGAINFWHFMAKMEAAGMRKLVDVADAASDLGLDPNTPLLGYVVKGELLRDHPDLVNGMAAASRAAKEILAADDAEWDRLRPNMNAKTDAQFEALKAGFRAGIPDAGPVDEAAAARMLALMVKLGGEDLLGKATELPEGTFLQSGS
ncbi:NitT/TauT family transport system substrate-binding protein [Litoreibacter halocynthiae]|uniref:NitT/TauT family transport system substrate-binding protein n=1 Tax=Litoreibacter halocynthiae TaxID=1242689 RepID=A0A4R7LSZ0_9RHOB|nr:ABC transporter substrate-binding protein [Litoreibacter halocynthiae]TDT77370.1 NitT/TauT family transport system substrate-binding protein [Litoreibacter halocynthiae]